QPRALARGGGFWRRKFLARRCCKKFSGEENSHLGHSKLRPHLLGFLIYCSMELKPGAKREFPPAGGRRAPQGLARGGKFRQKFYRRELPPRAHRNSGILQG